MKAGSMPETINVLKIQNYIDYFYTFYISIKILFFLFYG